MRRSPPRVVPLLAVVVSISAAEPLFGQTPTPDTPPTAAPAVAPAAQEYCPVTTDERIDPEVFADYKGTRVYFCCERCKKKFEREPETYAVKLAAFGTPQEAPSTLASPQPSATVPQPPIQPTAADHEHGHSPAAKPEGAAEPSGHERHEHEHGGSHTPRFFSWLGNFHPPMTNFPIGILVAAALAEVLFMRRKTPLFDHAARFGVWFAALTGVGAAALGWCFGGFRLVDSDPLLLTHRWLGTGTALWLLALLWASERARREGAPRGLYRFMLFGGAALVLVTGFFGGAMVYGLNHYGL